VVRGVTEEGRGLYQGGKKGCGRMNLRGEAQYREVGQSSFVGYE